MTRGRLDSLTGLRWWAALAVFAWHIQPTFGHSRVLYHLVRPGPLGVSFFFVLSGFVLVWSHRDGDRPRAFWRRRFARVYPNHVAAMACAVLVLHFAEHQHVGREALAFQVPLLQAWVPRQSVFFGVNGVSWSLACEALFYASFPLLLPLIVRADRRRVLGAALGAMAVLAVVTLAVRPSGASASDVAGIDWLAYIFPLGRLPEFVVGMTLARELQERRAWTIGVRWSLLTLGVACLVVMVAPTSCDLAVLTVAPVGSLIVAVAQRDLAGGTWLACRPLIRLGEWSFAFYLVHTLVLRVLLANHAPVPVVIVGGLAGSVVAAGLLHAVVERPCERRLRHARPRAQVEALEEAA